MSISGGFYSGVSIGAQGCEYASALASGSGLMGIAGYCLESCAASCHPLMYCPDEEIVLKRA
eukprot:1001467-Amphidinium_carterae.1